MDDKRSLMGSHKANDWIAGHSRCGVTSPLKVSLKGE